MVSCHGVYFGRREDEKRVAFGRELILNLLSLDFCLGTEDESTRIQRKELTFFFLKSDRVVG